MIYSEVVWGRGAGGAAERAQTGIFFFLFSLPDAIFWPSKERRPPYIHHISLLTRHTHKRCNGDSNAVHREQAHIPHLLALYMFPTGMPLGLFGRKALQTSHRKEESSVQAEIYITNNRPLPAPPPSPDRKRTPAHPAPDTFRMVVNTNMTTRISASLTRSSSNNYF
jgi:hypothetical protein